MRGFSGSGKSTRAREIADEIDGVVVNRDLIRMQLLGEWWTGEKVDEDRVTLAEDAQVIALLKAGVSTVVDATHLHTPYLNKWAKLATRLGVEFEVVDVHADVGECKRRVYQRWEHDLGSPLSRYLDPNVVEQQAKRHPAEKWPEVKARSFTIEPVRGDEDLPPAVLVDIDGTLAKMVGRPPYDYSRVLEDEVHEEIAWLVYVLHTWRHYTVVDWAPKIIIMSGRDDSCRVDTLDWLHRNGIPYDRLIMRPADAKDERGGKLPDYQVKYNLFNEHIRDRFRVLFVLDDRQQVVDMWRKLGLKCLQVAEGEF